MFLSIKQYAERVNLSETFIRSLAVSGELPSIMIGKRKRKINVEEADKTLKAYKNKQVVATTKFDFRKHLALLKMECKNG